MHVALLGHELEASRAGSMNRRISHALAMRSTWMPRRVTQVRLLVSGGVEPAGRPRPGLRALQALVDPSRSYVPRPSGSARRRNPSGRWRRACAAIARHRPRSTRACGDRHARPRGSKPEADPRPGRGQVVRLPDVRESLLDVGVADAVDEPRFAEHGLAAAPHDLLCDPLKVFARLLASRQHVDGVLERDGADALEPPPDLHAEIPRLRRDPMDQDEPARLGHRLGLLPAALRPAVAGDCLVIGGGSEKGRLEAGHRSRPRSLSNNEATLLRGPSRATGIVCGVACVGIIARSSAR